MKGILSFLKDIKADKKKYREMLSIVGIALFVVIVYINLFIKPTATSLYTVIPEAKSLRANIEKAKEEIAEEPALKQKLAGFEESLKSVRTRLPAEKEVPALLESLSSMARNSRVKIIGITPGTLDKPPHLKAMPASQAKTYQEIPISISAKSGYHELGKFISNLERLDRFMEVSDIKIKANPQSPKMHDVELKVITYILLNI